MIDKALEILKTNEFVAVATANKKGKPHSAPKFLLKINGRMVYFIDYSLGRTFENLKVNPEVSLSFINVDSLYGYRLNGKVDILEKGKIFDACIEEFRDKQIDLSIERVVKGVKTGKAHKSFALGDQEHFLVYVVRIDEGSEITPTGVVNREIG